jgi:DNA-binding NarL/FixJ family response regulator
VRVVICDDSILMREGIAAMLGRAGFDVTALAASPDELLAAVAEHSPDVAIIDVRMPPTYSDEGLRAAQELRASRPGIAIVILSQHVEAGMATRVLAETPARLGYLLKDRVSDSQEFAGTLRRVAAGGAALDPAVVSALLSSRGAHGPLAALSEREREVLALVAEGRSNKAIAERLGVSLRAVQKHVTSVFSSLGLEHADDDNRRILAVLAYLRAGAPRPAALS